MKRFVTTLSTAVVLLLPVLSHASTWNLDPDHTEIGFKVRHMMISNVKGNFAKYTGVVTLDEQALDKSRFEVTIDTASINTGIDKRDTHLRSPDFFDVANYPTMTYISRQVKRAGDGRYQVFGDLTLHGVTREVVLNVEGPTGAINDPWGQTRRGASATATINRKDFGLIWNQVIESGGVAVGDEITIAIELEMVKQS